MAPGRPSTWLGEAHFDDGLVVPAQPARRAVDICLTATDVVLRSAGRSTSLSWSDLESSIRSSAHAGDTWRIAPWSAGRAGPIGIGIAVEGCYVEASYDLRRAALTLMARIDRLFQHDTAVPLCARSAVSRAVDAQRELAAALCDLLADRPDLRDRLADPSRVERLVADITSAGLGSPPAAYGLRQSTTDVIWAMRQLGFGHRLHGRPLPGDEVPDEEVVIAAVLDQLKSNPHTTALDHAGVRAVVEEHLLAVEPWPFQALLEA